MELHRGPIIVSLLVACGAAGALACAGAPGTAAAEAGPNADAAALPDGPALRPDTGDAPGRDAEADAPADAYAVATGLPLPAGVAPPRRILDDGARLTGDGISSCSHQDPPSGNGDRWCAFTVPGPDVKTAALWVMNVTKAAAGPIPPCDGTDPACVRLTASLWTASPLLGPWHPYSHAFDGDTLVFYADSTTTSEELHRGPTYAWRPGWSRPRQIASASGFLCSGHPRAAVAYCLEDVVGDPSKPDSFELRAGSIAEESGGVLPSFGRIRPFRADGHLAWQVGFSPAGDLLAVSSPDPDPMVETLRVVASAEVGVSSPTEILRDLESWEIANDGTKIYFMRDQGHGGLFAASFPAGAAVVQLAAQAESFVLVGKGPADRGIAFLTRPAANHLAFRLAADPAMPADVREVFTSDDMLEDANISPDGRFTAWRSADLLARVVRHSDLGSCLLNTSATVHATAPRFLDGAGLVFWTQDTPDAAIGQDGFVGSAACQQRRRYAQGIYLQLPVADRGLVFGDELDDENQTVTLKYAGVTRTGEEWRLNEPVRVQDRVHPSVVRVGTDPLLLVFRQKTGSDEQRGTYVFGPVPF